MNRRVYCGGPPSAGGILPSGCGIPPESKPEHIAAMIRDDKGYWNQIGTYIRDHSEAEFSHSVCQECAKKHYPDMKIYDK